MTKKYIILIGVLCSQFLFSGENFTDELRNEQILNDKQRRDDLYNEFIRITTILNNKNNKKGLNQILLGAQANMSVDVKNAYKIGISKYYVTLYNLDTINEHIKNFFDPNQEIERNINVLSELYNKVSEQNFRLKNPSRPLKRKRC